MRCLCMSVKKIPAISSPLQSGCFVGHLFGYSEELYLREIMSSHLSKGVERVLNTFQHLQPFLLLENYCKNYLIFF